LKIYKAINLSEMLCCKWLLHQLETW